MVITVFIRDDTVGLRCGRCCVCVEPAEEEVDEEADLKGKPYCVKSSEGPEAQTLLRPDLDATLASAP